MSAGGPEGTAPSAAQAAAAGSMKALSDFLAAFLQNSDGQSQKGMQTLARWPEQLTAGPESNIGDDAASPINKHHHHHHDHHDHRDQNLSAANDLANAQEVTDMINSVNDYLLSRREGKQQDVVIFGGGGPASSQTDSLPSLQLDGSPVRDDEIALFSTSDTLSSNRNLPPVVAQMSPRQLPDLRESSASFSSYHPRRDPFVESSASALDFGSSNLLPSVLAPFHQAAEAAPVCTCGGRSCQRCLLVAVDAQHIDYELQEEDLQKVLSRFGELISVRVLPPTRSAAVVCFKEVADATQACRLLNHRDLRGERGKLSVLPVADAIAWLDKASSGPADAPASSTRPDDSLVESIIFGPEVNCASACQSDRQSTRFSEFPISNNADAPNNFANRFGNEAAVGAETSFGASGPFDQPPAESSMPAAGATAARKRLDRREFSADSTADRPWGGECSPPMGCLSAGQPPPPPSLRLSPFLPFSTLKKASFRGNGCSSPVAAMSTASLVGSPSSGLQGRFSGAPLSTRFPAARFGQSEPASMMDCTVSASPQLRSAFTALDEIYDAASTSAAAAAAAAAFLQLTSSVPGSPAASSDVFCGSPAAARAMLLSKPVEQSLVDELVRALSETRPAVDEDETLSSSAVQNASEFGRLNMQMSPYFESRHPQPLGEGRLDSSHTACSPVASKSLPDGGGCCFPQSSDSRFSQDLVRLPKSSTLGGGGGSCCASPLSTREFFYPTPLPRVPAMQPDSEGRAWLAQQKSSSPFCAFRGGSGAQLRDDPSRPASLMLSRSALYESEYRLGDIRPDDSPQSTFLPRVHSGLDIFRPSPLRLSQSHSQEVEPADRRSNGPNMNMIKADGPSRFWVERRASPTAQNRAGAAPAANASANRLGPRRISQNDVSVRKWTARYDIQIDPSESFQVTRRIIGCKGVNMKRVVNLTGSKLRLRGKGSGYLEGARRREADDPLHLCISSCDPDQFVVARRFVEELLEEIYREYDVWRAKELGLPPAYLTIRWKEILLPSKGQAVSSPTVGPKRLASGQFKSSNEMSFLADFLP